MGKVKVAQHAQPAERRLRGGAEPEATDARVTPQRKAITTPTPAQSPGELENLVRTLRQLGERMIAAASALEQSLRLWVLWDAAQDAMQDPRHASDSPAPRLTRRESETLTLYAQGVSFGDIARLQGVRISTVREQTQSARAKLEVATTAQAAAKARRLGLIP